MAIPEAVRALLEWATFIRAGLALSLAAGANPLAPLPKHSTDMAPLDVERVRRRAAETFFDSALERFAGDVAEALQLVNNPETVSSSTTSDILLARAFDSAVGILDQSTRLIEQMLSAVDTNLLGQPAGPRALHDLRAALAARFRLAAADMHRAAASVGGHAILSPWELAASAYFRVHLHLFHAMDRNKDKLPGWNSGSGLRRSSSRLSFVDTGGGKEEGRAPGRVASMNRNDSDAEMEDGSAEDRENLQTPTFDNSLRDPFAVALAAAGANGGGIEPHGRQSSARLSRGSLRPPIDTGPSRIKVASEGSRMLQQFPDGTLSAEVFDSVPAELLVDGLLSFRGVCATLSRLSLLRDLEPVYSDLVLDTVRDHIRSQCSGSFEEEELLEKMVSWAKDVAAPWIGEMIGASLAPPGPEGLALKREHAQWKNRIVFHTAREFAELRISEIFNMVVDFPNSLPALTDLRRAMGHVEAVPLLVQTLNNEIHRRLLHQGAQTKDILQWYINAIKAMRCLDPRGLVLARCGKGIRRYLRSREDTVRCIITAILDDVEGETFVAAEGASQMAMDEDEEEGGMGPNDEVVTDWADPNWAPAPMEADTAMLAESKHAADIMATLVSIYDTKEVFIREFQTLLADRLLGIRNYDTEREVRNLEMLKLRFGEASLSACEVMLKDLADSKRLDVAIQASNLRQPGLVPVHSMILSRLFWPTFRDDYEHEPLKVPPEVEQTMSVYGKAFSNSKAGRSLVFMPQLGSVDLELEMDDGRVLEFNNITPLQATLINLFQEQERWSLQELSEKTEVDEETLRRKIGFWVTNGLLREKRSEPDVWVLADKGDASQVTSPRESFGSGQASSPVLAGGRRRGGREFERRMRRLSDEGKPSTARAGASSAASIDDMRKYENFVISIIRNLGSMNAEQIHGRLTPFYQPPRQIADTRRLLDVMLVEDKLDHAAELYSLRRS